MLGRTLGRYRIVAALGQGGMGVVYRAEDSRLNRTVALKVLPADALTDPHAKERFLREAIAASALNHANIVTTYDIDRVDGVDFITMELIQGEPLAQAINGRALPIDRAIEYAMQLADALGTAHRAGIVHRDIKPANVIITPAGQVKVLDFGLAKLLTPDVDDAVGATVTSPLKTGRGTVLGTAAYMSPEQAEGRAVDARADVFALGVVLYEMLTGSRPFRGESYLSILTSVLRDTPTPVEQVRKETSPELARVVSRCLEKNPGARYAAGHEVRDALVAVVRATRTPGATGSPVRKTVLVAAAAVVVAVLAAAGWIWMRESRARTARVEGLPEIERLENEGKTLAALQHLRQIERVIPEHPDVQALRGRVTTEATIHSDPAGAEIDVQDFLDVNGPKERLGRTPIDGLRTASGYLRLTASKEGYEPIVVGYSPLIASPYTLKLDPLGTRPPGMVFVPARRYRYAGADPVDLGDYWIDQREVTNREFKKFVDAGGYRNRELWRHPFVLDGKSISWEEAMRGFQDSTGRPGPATWELGTYHEGKDDDPVGGVSWYEAAAYATFAGKSLPSIYHWANASGLGESALFSELVRGSNFDGKGPAVGSHAGVGPFGTYDMAGNVKEWCFNESAGRRYILGGSWNEPSYMFTEPDAQTPFDRRPTFGFRGIKPAAPVSSTADATLFAPVNRVVRDFARETPVSDEVFKVFRSMYAYDRGDLKPKVESVETTSWWRKETVSYAAAYNGERIGAYLFLPTNATPPYQAVIHFPGAYARQFVSSRQLDLEHQYFDFIVRSGRAVLFPIYKGTYERRLDPSIRGRNVLRDLVIQWSKDVGRSLDYLETRTDIDRGRLAFEGLSMGANDAPIYTALESRLKVSVLIAVGLLSVPRQPEIDPFNFIGRVTTPTLMVNGRQDFMRSYDTSQLPFFRALGTQEPHKRLAVFDGGHLPPRLAMIKEILDWLDRYLGPVKTSAGR